MARNKNMATKSKKKNNKELKILYIAGAILLVIVLFINVFFNKNDKIQEEAEVLSAEEMQNNEDKEIIAKLKNMEERDRMEFYFGMFLDYVENNEYEEAYDLLYSEFKENYFPTLESFTEYMQKTFTEMTNVVHDNIERNGDVYVLWIYISDAINGKPNESKKMNVVIRENAYNDIEMSFSII